MWSTRNNKPIVFEKSDTQALLDRAAMAQLHDYPAIMRIQRVNQGAVYNMWMSDRQQLTSLIAELANKVKELSS